MVSFKLAGTMMLGFGDLNDRLLWTLVMISFSLSLNMLEVSFLVTAFLVFNDDDAF